MAQQVNMGASDDAPVVLNEDFGNVVVVDNIPQVSVSKLERLAAVLRKVSCACCFL